MLRKSRCILIFLQILSHSSNDIQKPNSSCSVWYLVRCLGSSRNTSKSVYSSDSQLLLSRPSVGGAYFKVHKKKQLRWASVYCFQHVVAVFFYISVSAVLFPVCSSWCLSFFGLSLTVPSMEQVFFGGNDTTGCTQVILRHNRVLVQNQGTVLKKSSHRGVHPGHFPSREGENERRPISCAHFQLDKKEYPVVSQNDLGAPCCVVSPIFFLLAIESYSHDRIYVEQKESIGCLKKNQDAPRPSEHPPVRGENVKTFGWDHRLQIQSLFMAFKQVPLL